MAKVTIADRIRLIKAGYTKSDIEELLNLETEPDEPAGDPEPEEPEPEPEEPEPEPDPEPNYADDIAKLSAQLEDLTKLFQESNRNYTEGKKTDPADGEDILKQIIEKGVI